MTVQRSQVFVYIFSFLTRCLSFTVYKNTMLFVDLSGPSRFLKRRLNSLKIWLERKKTIDPLCRDEILEAINSFHQRLNDYLSLQKNQTKTTQTHLRINQLRCFFNLFVC